MRTQCQANLCGQRGGAAAPASAGPRRRFTLLELIIAMALLGALAALAVAIGSAVTASWSRILGRQEQFAELMTLDRTLDSMLSNTVPFSWKDEDENAMQFFRGDSDRLRLAYRHTVSLGDSIGIRFLEMYVNTDGQLIAEYASQPFWDPADLGEAIQMSVLAEGVREVSFRYADLREDGEAEDPPEWMETWLPEEWPDIRQRGVQRVPLGVMVTVEWEDDRVETWMRRTGGNSRHTRFGSWQPLPE